MEFDRLMGLENFLHDKGIEYETTKSDRVMIKALRGQRSSGTTGTTMGGSSDPHGRTDTSIPVAKELIRSVKRGSASHLALVMGLEGVCVKNGDQATIDRINELTANNEYEKIEANQFSWKFRNVAIHAGYGFELIGNRTYKLVLPQGMTNIKLS